MRSTLIHKGLSEQEVIELRAAGKGNNVNLQTSRSYYQIVRENIFTFINLVFFGISLIMTLLRSYSDAFLVVAIIFSGILVSVYQEIQAKQKLDRIALLHRPQATVIREGKERDITPEEIVLGDLLLIKTGDRIVVDGTIVGDNKIEVDESLLTGESDPVPKIVGDSVYSGTFCASGSAYFEAKKVGADTVAYKLMTGARAFRQVYTPLQREINLVIRALLLLACFLWILVLISFLSRSYSISDLIQHAAVVAGLVPSGLLIAITIAYGMGAIRMLGENILIQQANAVESLSNVDILCLDKTGTLTTNEIDLEAVYPIGMTETELTDILGDYAATTNSPNRTTEAIEAACTGKVKDCSAEIAFSSVRKWSAIAWRENYRSRTYFLGAPEILSESISYSEEMNIWIQEGTKRGLRVLLFAYSDDLDAIQESPQPQLPSHLQPLGIIHFSDRLRDNVCETLRSFAQAEIQLKIISGDNPETVAALAKQAGFNDEIRVVSGLELATMSELEFAKAAATSTVFGRITPEQKAKLVRTLRQQKHYVAMIGDGVNDVLSLKQANLGIAMESGSRATRSVADIVLLHDSFAALPHAFLEGQRIRNGIRDSLALFIVRVFCMALLIFATSMVTDSFPLLNKQSALLAMYGVGIPTIVLPLWAKPGIGQRHRSMIRSLLHFTIPATLSMTLVSLLVYLIYIVRAILNLPPNLDFSQVDYTLPRTALVTILVLCHLFLLPFLKPPTRFWVGGEPHSGDWRYSIAAVAVFWMLMLTLAIPPLRNFFELAPLSLIDIIFLVLIAVEWALILRAIWRTRFLDRFLGVDLG